MKVTVTFEVDEEHLALDYDGGNDWGHRVRHEMQKVQFTSETGLRFVDFELETSIMASSINERENT